MLSNAGKTFCPISPLQKHTVYFDHQKLHNRQFLQENKPEDPNEAAVSSATRKSVSTSVKDEDIFDDLDEQTDKLIEEMKANSREQKLLKIKDLDKMQADETKSNAALKTTKEDQTDKSFELFNNLGVKHMDQEDFQAKVAKEIPSIGLEWFWSL